MITQTTQVQEKSAETEIPMNEVEKKHLQDEGYEKGKKRVEAQLVIRLESGDGSV